MNRDNNHSLGLAVAFTTFALALTTLPPASSLTVAQEKTVTEEQKEREQSPALRALVGTWEGTIKFRGSVRGGDDRTLVIEDRDGRLHAKYGITGRKLAPVDLSVELLQGSGPKITFTTSAGGSITSITLTLVKEGWLAGVYRTASGGGFRERDMQLLRKTQ